MSDNGPSPLRRSFAPALAVFLASLVVSHICYLAFFSGGWSYEFSHYAEIARRFLDGGGLRTATFWPAELAYFKEAGVSIDPSAPLLFRYPAYALWCALWMALVGVSDYAMVLANIVAFAGWSVVVYGGTRYLFGSRAAAWTAGLWIFWPALQAGYVLGGFVDILFAFEISTLILASLWISKTPHVQTVRNAVFIGAGLGLAYLTRTNLSLWIPIFLALPFVAKWRSPRNAALGIFGGLLLLTFPWTVYRWSVFGASAPGVLLWNLAEYTAVKGLPWMEYRLYTVYDFLDPITLGRIIFKGWSLFNRFLSDLPSLWDLQIAMPFALLTLVRHRGEPRRFAILCAAMLLVELCVISFLRYQNLGFMGNHHYLWLAPWPLAFGVDFFTRRLERPWGRAIAITALIVQVQFLAWGYARTAPALAPHPSGTSIASWPEFRYLKQRVPKDARVMTNAPAAVAWYAERASINIPNRVADVKRITEDWRVDYLLFLTHPIGEPHHYPEWNDALRGALGDPESVFTQQGFKLLRRSDTAILFERAL